MTWGAGRSRGASCTVGFFYDSWFPFLFLFPLRSCCPSLPCPSLPSLHPLTMDTPTLDTIPPEILTRVAFYLAISPLPARPPTAQPTPVDPSRSAHIAAAATRHITPPPSDAAAPTVFPSPLVPLLHTSRAIHAALTFGANPSLYARIFEDKYDVAAARRRLPSDQVHDGALARELKQRCVAVRHLKQAVAQGDVARFEEQDVYTVYLMLIENGEPFPGFRPTLQKSNPP